VIVMYQMPTAIH